MKMIWPETSVRINDARARERQWRRDVAAGLAGVVEAMVLRLLFENVGVVCEITLCSLFFREQKNEFLRKNIMKNRWAKYLLEIL